MNGIVLMLVAAAVLVCGYLFYGRWLANKWGVDAEALTPARRMEDGKNFTELSRQTHKVVKSDAVVFKNYAWNGEAKGRYIRYQARAGEEFGGWVFTDEIVVE